MPDIAFLREERKAWRKDPLFGFVARPIKDRDGSLNFLIWECAVPGKKSTPWEGGLYKFWMVFSDDYLSSQFKCIFEPPFFHPNVTVFGTMFLAHFLNEEQNSRPVFSTKQILLDIQDILSNPDLTDPACTFAYLLYCTDRSKYNELVRLQARNRAAP